VSAVGRWGRPLFGLAVAAACIGLIFRQVQWGAIQDVWATASLFPLLLAAVALTADFALRIARWWWMLRTLEPGLPYRRCVRPFLVSLAVNNTLPLRAGDVVRAVGFRDALRAPAAHVVGTLVIERVLDALVLLALFFAGVVGVASGTVPRGFITAALAVGIACLAAAIAVVIAPGALRGVAHRVLGTGPLGRHRWTPRLIAIVDQLLDSLSIVRSPVLAAQLLAMSIGAWALEGAVFACVAWSLHAAAAPFGPWFSLATGTLATLLPSSPGYIGTFDYFAMLGLIAYGASRAAAAAFALLVHLVLWLPVTVAGAAFMALGGGFGAVHQAREAPDAT
jgi:glycosyltransferase 2 family protein